MNGIKYEFELSLHLSHLDSLGLDLLCGLDSGHHIGEAVGVCGVTIGVGVRDSIGGGDMGIGSGDGDLGVDGVCGGNQVVVGKVVVGHVVVGKGAVHSDGSDRSGNLDRLSSLRGGGLHGLEAASLNIPEGGHESLLSLGDLHGVIKVGIGNLRSLNVIVDRPQVDVISNIDCLVHGGESLLGGLDLGGVLEGEGGHGGEADSKSLKSPVVKCGNLFFQKIKLTILYMMVTKEGVPEKMSQLTAGLTFRAGFYTRPPLGVACSYGQRRDLNCRNLPLKPHNRPET